MRRWFTLRRLITLVALTLAWCALWGEVSAANVLSGLALAVLITASGLGTPGEGRIRIRPLLRFVVLVAQDLVISTISVAREILTPTDYTDEAIIAVAVPTDSRRHHLLLTLAITLTPGTAVVDGDPDSGMLYLHVLHADRRAATEAHVRELANLACRALPTDNSEASRSDQ